MPASLKPLEWQELEENHFVAYSRIGLFIVVVDEVSGFARLHFSGHSSDDDGIWYRNVEVAQDAAMEEYKKRALELWTIF